MGAFGIDNYKQEQGLVGAGTPTRFGLGRQGLTFLNPRSPQSDSIDVTTGAAGTWSILVTNDQTLESVTVTWVTAGATTAEAAAGLAVAWNADPNNLVFAQAVYDGADITVLNYRDDRFSYTAVVTEPGAGASTVTVTAESGVLQEFGAWAFRPLTAAVTAANARHLVNPSGSNVLENVAGIVIKALHVTNPDRSSTITYGHYAKGVDVPCMRRGTIMVPVAVAVKPGDAVRAIISGTDPRPGTTTNTGGVDLSSIASFISTGVAGGVAEVEITLA